MEIFKKRTSFAVFMGITLFSNGKEVELLQNQIKDAQRDIKHMSRRIGEEQDEIAKLLKEVKQNGKLQTELLAKMQEATEFLAIAKNDFEKAATDIALIRPTLEKKMLENFSSEIKQELANTTNNIQAQVAGFTATKNVFKEYARLSTETSREVEKLLNITKSINSADFELEMHAKRLETNDKEKLRLMKRVDELERLLARMKREKR